MGKDNERLDPSTKIGCEEMDKLFNEWERDLRSNAAKTEAEAEKAKLESVSSLLFLRDHILCNHLQRGVQNT